MEKLKSENLMTKNYLQKDGVIHQVLSISGSVTDNEKSIKKAATIKTDKSSEYLFLDHFEPIMINSDSLKLLGFHKSGQEFSHRNLVNYYLTQEQNSKYMLWEINNTTLIGTLIREVEYVHTLQNLYKINKEVDLILKKTKK